MQNIMIGLFVGSSAMPRTLNCVNMCALRHSPKKKRSHSVQFSDDKNPEKSDESKK